MEVPFSIVLIIILTVGVVAGVIYVTSGKYLGSLSDISPVTASLPAGVMVQKLNDRTYIVPIHFSPSTDKPIGVCRVTLVIYDTVNGDVEKESANLAVTPDTYRTEVILHIGKVSLEQPVIQGEPLDTKMIIETDKANYIPIAVEFYYCPYGETTEPKWSETLRLPETVLEP